MASETKTANPEAGIRSADTQGAGTRREPAPFDREGCGTQLSHAADSVLRAALDFLRAYWLRLLGISAVLVAPGFWQATVEGGDFPSHLYNAWLAQLIRGGKAPGLYLARQWNNVLYDFMLDGFGKVFGLAAGEKIAVAAAVLIFFWGAFALMCAMSRSEERRETTEAVPWLVLPCLAMCAYGWTFQMGFMNYYMSLGLAFAALAILARGLGWERLLVVPLAGLAWLAHPLGVLLLAGFGAYVLIGARLSLRHQAILFAACAAGIFAVHFYFAEQPGTYWQRPVLLPPDGADQLLLYGAHYRPLARALELFTLLCLAVDVWRRRNEPHQLRRYLAPLQLFLFTGMAIVLLPFAITVSAYPAPVGFLTDRLTSVSLVLICCLLAIAAPRRWHAAGLAAIAVVFFFFVYRDTAVVNRMEHDAAAYVRLVPPGSRVLATIWTPPGSRVFVNHIVDRACIGRCFSYADYEPPSLQFRVRATPGNAMVLADARDSDRAWGGQYMVQPGDLPVFEIYQCDLTMVHLCMRPLAAGELNGRVGVQRKP